MGPILNNTALLMSWIDLSHNVTVANCDGNLICRDELVLYGANPAQQLSDQNRYFPPQPAIAVNRELPEPIVTYYNITTGVVKGKINQPNETIAFSITRPLLPNECILPTDAIELIDDRDCFDPNTLECALVPHELMMHITTPIFPPHARGCTTSVDNKSLHYPHALSRPHTN